MYENYIQQLIQDYENNMNNQPEEWTISPKLSDKVDMNGELKSFFGTTTVITLTELDRQVCSDVQAKLLKNTVDMLAPLEPSTFHLTIHSLSNMTTVSRDTEAIQKSIEKHHEKIKAELRRIYELYQNISIRMRSLGPSTIGQEVISIKFVPDSQRDYELLLDLKQRFHAIFPLQSFFIPHVSLAYFKLRKYTPKQIQVLYDTMRELHTPLFSIDLNINKLVYQYHYTMNDYRDIDL